MEHYEKVKLVAPAGFEIDHVHDTIRLLQEIQSTLVLLSLDEAVCAVVELGQHDRDLVFGDAKLLIIVLIEGVVLVNGRILALVGLMGASNGRRLSSVRHCTFLHRPTSSLGRHSFSVPGSRHWSSVGIGRHPTMEK